MKPGKAKRRPLPYEQRPYRDCVGVALFNRAGLVFAGRRVDDPDGYWQMPQGGVDQGETPREAALRELREEVGTGQARVIGEIDRWIAYDVPPAIADRAWKGRYRGQRMRWFALRFTGRDEDIDLNAHEPEFSEWRWMRLDDLPRAVIGFKRDIYAEVAREFHQFARAAGAGSAREGNSP